MIEVEALPREDVLEYLEKSSSSLVIPYLVSINVVYDPSFWLMLQLLAVVA